MGFVINFKVFYVKQFVSDAHNMYLHSNKINNKKTQYLYYPVVIMRKYCPS